MYSEYFLIDDVSHERMYIVTLVPMYYTLER